MRYTNVHDLPLPLFQILATDDYDKVGDYSITELIGPVRAALLRKRHHDEIVVDVMTLAASLRGNALHYILSKAQVKGAIVEKRYILDILGKEVGLKADYVYPITADGSNYEQLDWKDCKVAAVTGELKDEWKLQNQCYAYGLRQQGINVVRLRNVCFLKDWSFKDAFIEKKPNYPDAEIQVVDTPMVNDSKTLEFLERRVKLFEDHKNTPDDELPECTDKERWNSSACWKVTVIETNRAVPKGKHYRQVDAIAFQEERWQKSEPQEGEKKYTGKIKRGDTEVRYFAGESIRCERGYCTCREFCNQYINKIMKDPF